MAKFCVICGKTGDDIIKGFCVEHYLKKNPVVSVPEKIQVEMERNTGRLRYRNKWLQPSLELLLEIIISKTKTSIEKPRITVREGQKEWECIVEIEGKIEGVEIEIEKPVTIQPVLVQSDEEMRLQSNYHEAILQIRFKEKRSKEKANAILQEALKMLLDQKEKDTLAGASGIKEKREGIDILIGSNRAAKKIAKTLAQKYHSEVTTAFKIVGVEKTGKERKRTTYCIRI